MFDVSLFLAIASVGSIAVVIGAPAQIRALMTLRETQRVPIPTSRRALVVGGVAQQVLLVLGAAAMGTWLAPRVGLQAPVFEALGRPSTLPEAVGFQLLPSVVLSVVATFVFLPLYYWVFRPRMDTVAVYRIESLRRHMGLKSRVLLGGVVEEVLFRWGAMTVCAWLAITVLGLSQEGAMWGAILGSGILFGLGHLPGARAVGVVLSGSVVATAIVLNLIVAIAFGWALWRYGLLAAMMTHGLLHVLWWPIDRRHTATREVEQHTS